MTDLYEQTKSKFKIGDKVTANNGKNIGKVTAYTQCVRENTYEPFVGVYIEWETPSIIFVNASYDPDKLEKIK